MDFSSYLGEILALRPPAGERGPENLAVLETVESTNLVAKAVAADYHRECQEVPEALFLAYEQTAGRGRLGRSWWSPPGQGVYATLSRPVDRFAALATLPLLVGVGLCRGLDPHLPSPCGLKWPNDLIAGGRKLGGILIESLLQPGSCAMAIVGFGVNHGGTAAAETPIEGATSLAALNGASGVSLAALTWELVAAVERELAHLGDEAYAAAAYRQRSVHRPGDRITARAGDEKVEGRFAGFDERGHLLLVRDDGGEVRLAAGEVIASAAEETP